MLLFLAMFLPHMGMGTPVNWDAHTMVYILTGAWDMYIGSLSPFKHSSNALSTAYAHGL